MSLRNHFNANEKLTLVYVLAKHNKRNYLQQRKQIKNWGLWLYKNGELTNGGNFTEHVKCALKK
mgnify:CR=1 FL=1